MKRFSVVPAVALTFLCGWVSLGLAQEIDVIVAESVTLEQTVLGLGVGFAPPSEGSEDYQGVPLLQARFTWSNGMYVSFLGNVLRANLIPDSSWQLGPLLRYRPERTDPDNEKVDAMKDVDAAIEAGAFLGYSAPHWIFMLSGAHDVSDNHDGYVVDFGAGYRHKVLEDSLLTVFAQATYASEEYMETYFAVSAEDSARSGLPRFSADAAMKDVGAGAALQYNINQNWGVLGIVKYTALLGDASDSPLVDDEGSSSQVLAGLLVNYRF